MEAFNTITAAFIKEAIHVHRLLGPGLFESVYEEALCYRMTKSGLPFRRQVPIAVPFESIVLDIGFKADLLIDDLIIVELKSVELIHAVHKKQLLTYLRLANKPIGLLVNFNEVLLKNGITRLLNSHFA